MGRIVLDIRLSLDVDLKLSLLGRSVGHGKDLALFSVSIQYSAVQFACHAYLGLVTSAALLGQRDSDVEGIH